MDARGYAWLAATGSWLPTVSIDRVVSTYADPFDLLCPIAFDVPLRRRRERAAYLLREQHEFFAR